jgi:DNA repair photolyase
MTAKTLVIYAPKGKAGEYSRLAVNLYHGCSHGCEYCYAPAFMRTTREDFNQPKPRENVIQKIKQDAELLGKEYQTGPVLLCFTCDPYQPIDEQYQLSRQAIKVLHASGLSVMMLTKGGQRAERDFDLLTHNDRFGVTLTSLDAKLSLQWEPGAALPEERINSLKRAHERGIRTWVSLEPVLYPEISLEIIRQTHTFVDEFKVGTLNYHPHAGSIDRHRFAVDVKKLLSDLNCDYYLKEDLRKWL